MQLSEISDLLSSKIPINDFRDRISGEIAEYRKRLKITGGSSPIYLNEDIATLIVDKADIEFLCASFVRIELDPWELNYICEALMLSSIVST